MGRKKRFDTQAGGFLWWTWAVKRIEEIAANVGQTPSDIYREAMRIYMDIKDGKAVLTYVAQPPTGQEGESEAKTETPAVKA